MNQLSERLKNPTIAILVGLLAGLILGVLYGWFIDPIKWINAPIEKLRADLQTDYLRMAIDSYTVNKDDALLVARYQALGADAPTRLGEIISTPGKQDPAMVLKVSQLVSLGAAASATPTQAPAASGGTNIGQIIIIMAIVLILGVGAAFAFWLFRTSKRTGDLTPAQQARALSQQVEKTDFGSVGQSPPIAQYVTTYVLGDDLFDDSFSIDSPTGEFLGECGVGISETIGVGDPKKVTAFEVWMFDKNDIQTVTKVLMSSHAYNDPNLRAKLESKGELVPMEPGQKVVLETATLQMVASVPDMQYGQGALPQGSYYDRLTLELAIWPRKA